MNTDEVTDAQLTNMMRLAADAWTRLTGDNLTLVLDKDVSGSQYTLHRTNGWSRSDAPGVQAGGFIGRTRWDALGTLNTLRRAWFDAAPAVAGEEVSSLS